jgi:hypothetical protein
MMLRLFLTIVPVMFIVGIWGCGQSKAPPAPASDQPSVSPASPRATAQPAAVAEVGPNIPKDARWTIFCQAIGGPDHVLRGKARRDYLMQVTKLRDWHIVHEEQETTIYYGFYKEIDEKIDPREAARKQADLKAVLALVDPQTGGRMFRAAFVTPLGSADPIAPPEWNLLNAKGDAYYTLEICVYKDSPERKQAAVDSVREARKQGVEAYYYHGPTSSSVCVGLFPQSAVRVVRESSRSNGSASGGAGHPGAVVGVAGMDIPDAAKGRDDVEVVQDKTEIVDPKLNETIGNFPYHTLNGYGARMVADPKTGTINRVHSPSVVVKVPRMKDGLAQPTAAAKEPKIPQIVQPVVPDANINKPAAPPDPFGPASPPASKGGQLKSINDK